ncbi:hypothetical protein FHG87_003410 [Trinorchestia longiramus]|nr:hypothetical protein FHG87_003410 [Trinorchestia longiramus]
MRVAILLLVLCAVLSSATIDKALKKIGTKSLPTKLLIGTALAGKAALVGGVIAGKAALVGGAVVAKTLLIKKIIQNKNKKKKKGFGGGGVYGGAYNGYPSYSQGYVAPQPVHYAQPAYYQPAYQPAYYQPPRPAYQTAYQPTYKAPYQPKYPSSSYPSSGYAGVSKGYSTPYNPSYG